MDGYKMAKMRDHGQMWQAEANCRCDKHVWVFCVFPRGLFRLTGTFYIYCLPTKSDTSKWKTHQSTACSLICQSHQNKFVVRNEFKWSRCTFFWLDFLLFGWCLAFPFSLQTGAGLPAGFAFSFKRGCRQVIALFCFVASACLFARIFSWEWHPLRFHHC